MTYFLSPIVGVAATSPARRTRPFCRYRDIFPVSTGTFTRFSGGIYPEGGSNLFVIAREQRDRGNPHEKVRILFQRFSALTLDFGEKSEYNNIL